MSHDRVFLRTSKGTENDFSARELVPGIQNGDLIGSDEISPDGNKWIRLDMHPQLKSLFSPTQNEPAVLQQPPQPENPVADDNPVKFAGGFKRCLAFTIDTLLVFTLGSVLTYPLSGIFAQSAEIYTAISLVIFLAYFSICESERFGGKTFGKKVMSMRVIQVDGKPLPLKRAFFRSFLFFIFFYTLDIVNFFISRFYSDPTKVLDTGGAVWIIATVIIILWSIGNLFFIVFHPQKRGLHDLPFSAVVLKKGSVIGSPCAVSLKPILALALATILTCLPFYYLYSNFLQPAMKPVAGISLLQQLNQISQNLGEGLDLININVSKRTTSFHDSDNKASTTNILVIAMATNDPEFHGSFRTGMLEKIGSILKNDKTFKNLDIDEVVVELTFFEYFGLLRFSIKENHPIKIR